MPFVNNVPFETVFIPASNAGSSATARSKLCLRNLHQVGGLGRFRPRVRGKATKTKGL